jgi:acyl transferase domain-containing protein/NADP-dependent 3-hydroxy acid dehydrogenase YdfG/acyl carrier protein
MHMSRPGAFDEAIAIIGIGCRFPGGASSPAAFWELIASGADAIVEVPRQRWNIDRFYDPDPEAPGKMYVRAGGFLQEPIDRFDALFFGMSPREAAYLDPQQRVLLEVAWEALEDAGLAAEGLAGSDAGVYVGGFMLDNLLTQLSPLNRDAIGPHTAVGSTMSILSNRISYAFDLRGPSLSMDTACSSSLVAFHQACQALRRGECSLALAGGVNVMHRPESPISMCKGGFLSRDGRCKSFDARADGYGRGEGAGLVVLKPLVAARRDGDRIYAVVRGTGVNQDGRTEGITVPNPEAQEALVRKVCTEAEVDPRWVRYVEAHGTGTALGDPLESAALGAVIGRGRGPEEACVVGSVKANIGHLEAASGVAGVIKAALCLTHRQIPPLAGLTQPNPKIPFEALGLRLPRGLEAMPNGNGPRCVGINSFGYGGTNAHAILQEAPAAETRPRRDAAPGTVHLLPLSARSAPALEALAKAYRETLGGDAPAVEDLCYSAAVRRSHHDHRLAVIGDSREALAEALRAFLAREASDAVAGGTSLARGQRPVFVFTGMGPQWWGMGRELLREEPVFRAFAEECDAIFRRLAGWSILAEMTIEESGSRIGETQIAQPANFVLQAGLATLLRARGIEPAAVVGHSVGEVTSAYVSGVLDLEAAVRVSYERSRIQKKAAGLGTMLAVGLSEEAVAPFVAAHGGRVSLAAANSPNAVTLAGDTSALEQIAEELKAKDVFNRFLQVEVAYHSPTMDPLQPELLAVLRDLPLRAPALPLYSTVSGDLAEPGAYDAAYWCRNIRQPVYFARAMSSLLRDGHRVFLEIGPHPVLSTSIKQCLAAHEIAGVSVASLRREQPERRSLAATLAALYAAGCRIDWRALHAEGGAYVELPRYPWQREVYWHESEAAHLDRVGAPDHALLGRRVDGPTPQWEASLNRNLLPYVADHRVEELVVLPGAAYVELGLAVHRETTGAAHAVVEALEFHKALVVDPGDEPVLRVTYDDRSRECTVHSRSREATTWSLHARGRLSHLPLGKEPAAVGLEAIRERCSERIEATAHYEHMRGRGLHYGPYFQGVRELWRRPDGGETLAWIEGDAALAAIEHHNALHPTLLDACFQALLATLTLEEDPAVYVPVALRQVRLRRTPSAGFWCHGQRHLRRDGVLEGDITLVDRDGGVLAEVRGVRAQALRRGVRDDLAALDQWLYEFVWEAAALEPPVAPRGRWVVLLDAAGVGEALARQLEAAGAAGVTRVVGGEAFARESDERYAIRTDSTRDMQRLVEELGTDLEGVVSFWSLDAAADGDPVGTREVVSALHLMQALVGPGRGEPPRLVFVTRQAQLLPEDEQGLALAQTPLIGLVRVAAIERPELRCRVVDVDSTAEALQALGAEVLSRSSEEEVALRGASRHVHRLLRRRARDLDAAAGTSAGEAQPRREPRAGEVEVEVSRALEAEAGRLDAVAVVTRIGAEVDGHRPGDAVLVCLEGPLTRHATLPARSVFPLGGSVRAGAGVHSVQLPALAAAHAAVHRAARLQESERVLVHPASGPVGRAAVQVARWVGAVVFATAEGAEACEALRGLGVEHVFDCASAEFEDEIRERTGGQGLDVVVSAASGETAAKGLALLAPFGRFVAVGRGAAAPAPRHSNQTIAAVDVHQMAWERPELFAQLLAELRAADFGPLPAGPIDAVEPPAAAPPLFEADASYLITGGFGGFGLEMAAWMVAQGARHLVLVGRRGAATPEARRAVAELAQAGATVTPIAADVSKEVEVIDLIAQIAATLPPLRGVFHTAAVLDDGPIDRLDRTRMETVLGPKALGAWHLHRHTVGLPLDHFVLFSSIASLIGSPGQATYVAANTFLDALAQYRRRRGLAATSINWGALGQVGMAARHQEVEKYFERVGIGSFTPAQAVRVFGRILRWKPAGLGAAIMNWPVWGEFNPAWAASPRYQALAGAGAEAGADAGDATLVRSLRELDAEARAERMTSVVIGLVAETLRLPVEKVDPAQTLLSMGVDSLMAMELQTAIEKTLGVKVSTLELMKGTSLAHLARHLAAGFGPAQPAPVSALAPAPAPPTTEAALTAPLGEIDAEALLARLDHLSDEQVEQLIDKLVPGEEIGA